MLVLIHCKTAQSSMKYLYKFYHHFLSSIGQYQCLNSFYVRIELSSLSLYLFTCIYMLVLRLDRCLIFSSQSIFPHLHVCLRLNRRLIFFIFLRIFFPFMCIRGCCVFCNYTCKYCTTCV